VPLPGASGRQVGGTGRAAHPGPDWPPGQAKWAHSAYRRMVEKGSTSFPIGC